MNKVLMARKATLESSFFAEENAALAERLKREADQRTARAAMADALSINDDALADHLLSLGVTPGGALALTMVPLVAVAWVDYEIQAGERKAILAAAAERGITADSVAGELLAKWLEKRPEQELFEAWKGFATEIAKELDERDRTELRSSVVAMVRGVAEASGGLLGLAWTVSDEEKAVIAKVEEALS